MKKTISCIVLIAVLSAGAGLKPGAPFRDGAVLQRGFKLPVWGRGDAGVEVTVEFAGQTKRVMAGADGRWRVDLEPLAACADGRELRISAGAESVAVKDVLVGEVWFASGQSNMKCPIRGPSPRFRDGHGRLESTMVREPEMRYFKVMNGWSTEPEEDTKYGWYRFTAEGFDAVENEHRPSLSAVAFYYAVEIHRAARVPIGIIESSIGGTGIDAWTPRSGTLSRPELKDIADYKVRKDWVASRDAVGPISSEGQQPGVLYNAMVAPFAPFAIRGMIWYQGCHDAFEPQRYLSKMHALYNGWSKEFENPGLEFYFVELAPYDRSWFDIQQAQHRFAEENPRAAIAISCDAGNPNDIHHNEKRTVAVRLAAHALKRLYGFPKLEDESPRPVSASAKDGTVTLAFGHAKDLYFYNIPRTLPDGFELAGPDGKWHKAEIVNAVAEKTSKGGVYYPGEFKGRARHIELRAEGVNAPARVRYLFHPPWTGCIYNESDLPLGSFEIEVR